MTASLSALGVAILVYGLVALDPWATVCGVVGSVGPKVWMVDRMVWLYHDMRDKHEPYAAWLR